MGERRMPDQREFETIPEFDALIRVMRCAETAHAPAKLAVEVMRKIASRRCAFGFMVAGYVNIIGAAVWLIIFRALNSMIYVPFSLKAQIYCFSGAGCSFFLLGFGLLRWPDIFKRCLPASVPVYLMTGSIGAAFLAFADLPATVVHGTLAVLTSYLLTAWYLYELSRKFRVLTESMVLS